MKTSLITVLLAFGLLGHTAQAQGYSPEALAKFNAETVKHKVDIYVENTRAIQDGPGTLEQKKAQIDSNLYYTAMCSIERSILLSVTGEQSLAQDALQLVNHYDFLAQAMEKMGLINAQKARQDYMALRPQGEAYLGELYKVGSVGTDPKAKAEMLKFSDICRQVTLAAREIDAQAMQRQSSGR